MMPKRRTILRLAGFLLLGVAVNVAVAWGCACHSLRRSWFENMDNVLYVSSENPLTTLSHDFGVVHTRRTWGLMAVTWACPVELLNTADFRNQLPRWSALRNGLILQDACEAYGFTGPAESLSEIGAGWPAISLRGAHIAVPGSRSSVDLLEMPLEDSGGYEKIEVPYSPTWPGFAINTVFYAAILWGGWLLAAAPFVLRRRRRIKRGLCPACAYPVGASDVCTECGGPVRSCPTSRNAMECRHK